MKRSWLVPLFALLPLACLLAAFFLFARPEPAFAQNASCGEPQHTHGTIVMERCIRRTFNIGGQAKKLIVYYTTVNGSDTDRLRDVDADGNPANGNERSADALAEFVADRGVEVWQAYRAYGFPDPHGRSTFKIVLFDMRPGLLGWCCGSDNFEVDAPHVVNSLSFDRDPRNLESVVYHEMWHAARYSGAFGAWAIEGGASHMTDHVNLPVDNDDSNDYIGRAMAYLRGGFAKSLTDHAYDAALWWQYFSERASSGTDPVQRGVDAVKAFWDDSAATDMTRMDNVIRARAPGETFESLWIDFAVANFAKDLTGPNVPAKYRYFDATHSGAPAYSALIPTAVANLTAGSPVIPTLRTVNPWSAQYYRFNPAASVPVINIEVRQELNRRLAYSLLVVDNNDIVSEQRHIGRNFSVSFANNGYDAVVLVVVGLNERANFRYSANAAMSLNIVDPLAARPVQVGGPATPDKMLVKVDAFAGPGGDPIVGIDPNSFEISVGGVAVQPADRISAAYIQGQYWLLVRAPVQAAAGNYDLTVRFAGLTDTETAAVRYVDRADASTVVVIDRSGSMNAFGKLQAAKDAARLYIDSWRMGDLIGVASFNQDATVDLPLGAFETERDNAINAINALAGAGETSIGDGAQAAMQNLIDRDASARSWSIMLLSDGIENSDIKIADFLKNYNDRRNASPAGKVPRVIAVALGPDADRARMEKLASDTGGVYYVAAVPTTAGALGTDAVAAASLSNDLAEIYRAGSEFIAGQQQIGAQTWPYDYSQLPKEFKFRVDGAASEVVFVVKWDSSETFSLPVGLRTPSGVESFPTPDQAYGPHKLFRVAAPEPGEWTVVIHQAGPTAAAAGPNGEIATEILVEAAVSSNLTLDAFLGLPVEQRLVGKAMPIYASLSDAAPLPGAAVNAFITGPLGSYSVALLDDGAHGDGAAGDGFYAGTFYQTQEHGAYDVEVVATGSSSGGEPFERRVRLGFNMLQSRILDPIPDHPNYDPNHPVDWNNPNDPNRPIVDSDGDGIVDWWEEETGLDPDSSVPGQGTQDPDWDGLSNQEEFNQGTDPLSSDSDQGGQNDGSEVTSGNDPRDPVLDQTPCPRDFEASSTLQAEDERVYTGAVILTYEVDPDHTSFSLWRQVEGGSRNFITDSLPPTGIYSDTDVVDGTTYHYWVWANDAEGHASCVLGPSTVTLDPDAAEPEGVVTINDGAVRTHTPEVTLQLNASEGTTEMQVRNGDPLFSDTEGWEPYRTTKAWTLAPENDIGVVFVRFRDAAGNVSEPAVDTIEMTDVVPPPPTRQLYLPGIFRR